MTNKVPFFSYYFFDKSSIGYGGTNTLGTFLEQFLSMGIPAQFYGKIFWNKEIAQTNLEK